MDFKGTRRTRETHVSTSDPDALLFTKSRKAGAIPSYMGHALMENRSAIAIDVRLTPAEGTAERDAALEMLAAQSGGGRISVGTDKAYDHAALVDGCRALSVVPHVAQNENGRRSRIDGRTTRHEGYSLSQIVRKLIETHFGDAKQHGTLRQVKVRGLEKVESTFILNMAVSNLRRLARLIAWPSPLATG